MSNNSSTGGYLLPSPLNPFPGGLSVSQFIQTVLVGISGLKGELVRPSWQQQPPKQLDIDVNWMAFGITQSIPDANGYNWIDDLGVTHSQRHADLKINCSFYGPDCMEYADLVRDGFQIGQNLSALNSVNMGFVSTGSVTHLPDLVNGRWVNRCVMELSLRREIIRVYPILSFISAQGTIHTVLGNEEYLLNWES